MQNLRLSALEQLELNVVEVDFRFAACEVLDVFAVCLDIKNKHGHV